MPTKNLLQWDIQTTDESLIVRLSGDFTRNTLLPLWRQRASFLSPNAKQTICWDLNGLNSVDSAGFALFVELLNHYHKQHKNEVINPPMTIITLADLFNLSAWLKHFLYPEGKHNYGTKTN